MNLRTSHISHSMLARVLASVPAHLREADFWDLSGMALSALCLLHCFALPLLLILDFLMTGSASRGLWSGGSNELAHGRDETSFHVLMLCAVALFGGIALFRGYAKHKSYRPALFVFLGILLLVAALLHFEHASCFAFFHDLHSSIWWEPALTSLGGLLLLYGHYRNIRPRSCACCAG